MVVLVCISDYIAVRKIRHSLVCHLQVLMFSVVTHSYSWCFVSLNLSCEYECLNTGKRKFLDRFT